ncbi:hypothetical protein GCM10023066_12200 [Nocardioides kongjuensis]
MPAGWRLQALRRHTQLQLPPTHSEDRSTDSMSRQSRERGDPVAILRPGGADSTSGDDYDPFAPVEGDVIRLMAKEDVDCPLWHAGLLFSDAEEFIEFGAPPELARDLAAWAADRQANGRHVASDIEAAKLVERLSEAFDHRYRFVFRP